VDPGVGMGDVEKGYFLTLPGLELRPLGRPARSQSQQIHIYFFNIPMGIGGHSPVRKRPETEAHHSPQPHVEVKNRRAMLPLHVIVLN
jgi:hypothetical protein